MMSGSDAHGRTSNTTQSIPAPFPRLHLSLGEGPRAFAAPSGLDRTRSARQLKSAVPVGAAAALSAATIEVPETGDRCMPFASPHFGVLYEHPEWFGPLFAELDRRSIGYDRILATSLNFNPADGAASYALVLNRMSPSAYVRGHGHALFASLA